MLTSFKMVSWGSRIMPRLYMQV